LEVLVELFRWFPTFNPLPREEQQLIPLNERNNYPSFAADFALLDKELMPYFRSLDNEALRQQNWYRWMYIILIFGGSLSTILAIVQLAFLNADWPGIVGAIVAAVLGVTTALSRTFNHHERYLNARLATERFRSEYFLFLGRYEPYTHDKDRVHKLLQRIAEIKAKGESNESV
jgi:hypothetical protein